jgi:hypothetical protein
MKYQICTRLLATFLTISICGTADLAQALQTATQAPAATTQDTTPSPAPVPPATPGELPNAPSTDATQSTSKPAATMPTTVYPNGAPEPAQNQNATPQSQQPLGTAAAEKGVTRGGAASRPAGTAIAGVKQRQSRSFLIKLGAVAAAGVALGTVYALTKGTGSVPPGAVR